MAGEGRKHTWGFTLFCLFSSDLQSSSLFLFTLVFVFPSRFSVGINPFSDMTFAEFKRRYLWSEPQVGVPGPWEQPHRLDASQTRLPLGPQALGC